MKSLLAMLKSRKGQGTIEYAMATLVVIAVLAAILALTDNPLKTAIQNSFTKVSDSVNNVQVQ